MKFYSTILRIIMGVLVTGALMTATATSALATRSQEAQENKKSAAQEKLQRQARITMDQARETALKRAPGTVEDGELEREHGRLVYSFDIRNAKGTIDEVQVSAISGRIVRVEHESKAQEAAEKRKESKQTKKP